MGFFEDVKLTLLLAKRYGEPTHEKRIQFPSVKQTADLLVDDMFATLGAARTSTDIGTRKLNIAANRADVRDLKRLAKGCRTLRRADLEKVEDKILQIEKETDILEKQAIAKQKREARKLEKRGAIRKATAVYEELVAQTVESPFSYRRLAILYRKLQSSDDEIRVLQAALKNIPKSNRKHHAWFKARLHKIEQSALLEQHDSSQALDLQVHGA